MNATPTNQRRAACGLALALSAVVLSAGCRLTRPFAPSGPPAPVVLQPQATAAQIVAAINQNSARVRTYTAPNASFTTPGLAGVPLLRGSIVLERPRRFRLRAGTSLSGNEVDMGSNDELFWLWAKRNEPPAVYFARHDQHASGAAQQLLPIDPMWVVDALGLVTLDPTATHNGPLPRPDGSLELRSRVQGPKGLMERVTVVDPSTAWVIEQHVYDALGKLVASATATDFRFDPTAQVSLPQRVTLRIPTAELSLTINTGLVSINTPVMNPNDQWSLPMIDGCPQVDLGRSDGLPVMGSAAAPPALQYPATSYPAAAYPAAQAPVTRAPATQAPATYGTTLPAQAPVYDANHLPPGGIVLPSP